MPHLEFKTCLIILYTLFLKYSRAKQWATQIITSRKQGRTFAVYNIGFPCLSLNFHFPPVKLKCITARIVEAPD